jgi:hypothetical protein
LGLACGKLSEIKGLFQTKGCLDSDFSSFFLAEL